MGSWPALEIEGQGKGSEGESMFMEIHHMVDK